MTILNKLATSLGRRDEIPNQLLAAEIVRTKDKRAVQELIQNLSHKDKAIQSDCIKVLYEIGASAPRLIAPYYKDFGDLLESRNNRLIWGAMTALDAIAAVEPEGIYGLLARVLKAADEGSVITRDHAVGILIELAREEHYTAKCFPLLLEQLRTCPNNQLAMYAEKSQVLFEKGSSSRVLSPKMIAELEKVLVKRLAGLEKASQKARVAKVLKRFAGTAGVPPARVRSTRAI
jgi:HEAT repeat protein